MIRQNGTTTYRRQVAGAMLRFEPHNDQNVANSPRAYRLTDHLGSATARPREGSMARRGIRMAIHRLKSIHEATHPARLPDGLAERVQGSDDPADPEPTADGASRLASPSRADVLDALEREDEDENEAE